jgi:hypothetical protein
MRTADAGHSERNSWHDATSGGASVRGIERYPRAAKKDSAVSVSR